MVPKRSLVPDEANLVGSMSPSALDQIGVFRIKHGMVGFGTGVARRRRA